jgi:hypothetical protein
MERFGQVDYQLVTIGKRLLVIIYRLTCKCMRLDSIESLERNGHHPKQDH